MANLKLAEPLTLPCGLTLPNRVAKASTTEQLSDTDRLPTTDTIHGAYASWAEGGWGLILTGNAMLDLRYMGGPADLGIDKCLPKEKTLAAYKRLAETCSQKGTPTILQINHTGRQSHIGCGKRGMFEKTIAPSAVGMDFGSGMLQRFIAASMFGRPKEMTVEDIEDVVKRFAYAAEIAVEAGFQGVQIHAAHGYLLSQFLSARSNLRKDAYGGSPLARAKIVLDIIHAVRAVVPPNFCVAMKLNSVDHQSAADPNASSELHDVLEQAKAFVAAGLDFIELSGGSYENPCFLASVDKKTQVSDRTQRREAFFIEFADAIRKEIPDTILMLTGGFRSRLGMEKAVTEGSCDLVGLSRPSILAPSFPKDVIFNNDIADEDAEADAPSIATSWLLKKIDVKAVGVSVESLWYTDQIKKMGESRV